jgi:hypothetical protein
LKNQILDYDWQVIKDDSTGKLTVMGDTLVKKEDTTHLFFTANCNTNIQGGYNIRYCSATIMNDSLVISFADGLPAYASSFYIIIKKDRFYFVPKIIYPQKMILEKITYSIEYQKLHLTKSTFKKNENISGYINVSFVETTTLSNRQSHKRVYFLNGYFNTVIN